MRLLARTSLSGLVVFSGLLLFRTAAAGEDYRFELVGKPEAENGNTLLHVKLVHLPDNKPVDKAIITAVQANMGPSGMETMNAPAMLLSDDGNGVYTFAVAPDMSGSWAIRLSAKIDRGRKTVSGTIKSNLQR